ncbi:hypothetical protein D187_007556 [Cystobacter fuscus DSM 2262]|uniref:Uncharacterized protein n=1 Tax=Cystobacter fuscus (strain ATCC 25194 / DSM 2262 / NBRC 100088 / M29) TaxID=1242864 RepID=S9Q4G7_CYSF2|nr:hypothetical protein D187_007556 [Cystobacter fuscus DSM 2262]
MNHTRPFPGGALVSARGTRVLSSFFRSRRKDGRARLLAND